LALKNPAIAARARSGLFPAAGHSALRPAFFVCSEHLIETARADALHCPDESSADPCRRVIDPAMKRQFTMTARARPGMKSFAPGRGALSPRKFQPIAP
jgi:hypothetical protein